MYLTAKVEPKENSIRKQLKVYTAIAKGAVTHSIDR